MVGEGSVIDTTKSGSNLTTGKRGDLSNIHKDQSSFGILADIIELVGVKSP